MSTFTPAITGQSDPDKKKKSNDDVVLTPSPPKDAASQLGPSFDAKVGLTPGSDKTFRDVHREEVRELTPSVKSKYADRAKAIVARKMQMKDRAISLGLSPSRVAKQAEDAGLSLGAYLTREEGIASTGLSPGQQLVDRNIQLGRYSEDQRTARTQAEQQGQDRRLGQEQQFTAQQRGEERTFEERQAEAMRRFQGQQAESDRAVRLQASKDDLQGNRYKADAQRREPSVMDRNLIMADAKQNLLDTYLSQHREDIGGTLNLGPQITALQGEIKSLLTPPEAAAPAAGTDLSPIPTSTVVPAPDDPGQLVENKVYVGRDGRVFRYLGGDQVEFLQ